MTSHNACNALAALFDLDGVLIDSETTYTEIWEDIDRRFPTGIANFALRIKGTTLPDILSTYYPDLEMRSEVVELLKKSEDDMAYPLFDGVIDFLDELKANDIPAAIVTSSNARKMERLFASLPGFRDYFDAVITDADVTHSKPHPEGYLSAAGRLGRNPGRHCFVFEDSLAGLAAGNAAGASVIALSTTNPADMLAGRAHRVIGSFREFSVSEMSDMAARAACVINRTGSMI